MLVRDEAASLRDRDSDIATDGIRRSEEPPRGGFVEDRHPRGRRTVLDADPPPAHERQSDGLEEARPDAVHEHVLRLAVIDHESSIGHPASDQRVLEHRRAAGAGNALQSLEYALEQLP